jgi:hypothetical protein
VKGLRCLEAGDMREARRALFCALRYQPDLTPSGLGDQLHAVFENGSAATLNGNAATAGHDVLRAWCALLPHRIALEAMRRKRLLEIPPRRPATPASPKNCSAAGCRSRSISVLETAD